MELVVDLGHISLLSETNFSSSDDSMYTPSPTSPTESEIVKDSLGNMVMSDQDWSKQSKEEQDEKNTEEETFRKKLTKWLNENNLRLTSEFNSEFSPSCVNVVEPIKFVPPNLIFERENEDVIADEEQSTMGQIVSR
uniref:Uncharacterized protein n=1 Tax=Cucumis melo TaxID=3656 RepID=A0A9I9D8U8_CUCME